MFKPHTVLGLGLWLILLNFFGVPSVWKVRLYMLTGIVLVFVYLVHLGRQTILSLAEQQAQKADTFVENGSSKQERPATHHNPVS